MTRRRKNLIKETKHEPISHIFSFLTVIYSADSAWCILWILSTVLELELCDFIISIHTQQDRSISNSKSCCARIKQPWKYQQTSPEHILLTSLSTEDECRHSVLDSLWMKNKTVSKAFPSEWKDWENSVEFVMNLVKYYKGLFIIFHDHTIAFAVIDHIKIIDTQNNIQYMYKMIWM